MSSRNTPVNARYAKLIGSLNAKTTAVATGGTTSTTITPSRSTFGSTIKTSTANSSDARALLRKQMSSCELRESRKPDDDVLNMGFACSSPVLSKIQKFQLKSKSTTTINTPSSMHKPPLSTNTHTPRPSAFKSTPVSTPRPLGKRLFFNSTGGIGEHALATTRTPDYHLRTATMFGGSGSTPTPAPRSHSKSTDDDTKYRDTSEISNLTVAVRVRPMNAKECTIPSMTNVVSVEDNEVTVLAGINADSSAGVSHSFHYDYAFWSCNPNHEDYADQETVFRGTTMPLVDKAFAGYNACLFAYGQTGSGKSYSMMGIDNGRCFISLCPQNDHSINYEFLLNSQTMISSHQIPRLASFRASVTSSFVASTSAKMI